MSESIAQHIEALAGLRAKQAPKEAAGMQAVAFANAALLWFTCSENVEIGYGLATLFRLPDDSLLMIGSKTIPCVGSLPPFVPTRAAAEAFENALADVLIAVSMSAPRPGPHSHGMRAKPETAGEQAFANVSDLCNDPHCPFCVARRERQ